VSTQTILAAIGYAVGSYFGYPQLGAIVGSLVGAALAPTTKTTGPRLDDQKVTVSTYGAGVPTIYGNVRVGGNVVDSTDKIEIGTTTSQGKGGGTENTSYKYFVHMAVSLCATPVDGSLVSIRKIWKDGKLIYNASSGIPLASAIASTTSPYSFAVLYQGREDQLPDPLEELQHGIGNVPAYRGVVRVRLNAVECPGGRVPQFSFELCVGASFGYTVSDFYTGPDASVLKHCSYAPDFSSITTMFGRNWTNGGSEFGVEVQNIFPDGSMTVMSRFTAATSRMAAAGNSDEVCFVNTGATESLPLYYYKADGSYRTFQMAENAVSDWVRYAKRGKYFAAGLITGFNAGTGPFIYDFESGVMQGKLNLGTYVSSLGLSDLYLYVLRNSVIERYLLADLSYQGTVGGTLPFFNATGSVLHVVSDNEIWVSQSDGSVRAVLNGILTTKFTGLGADFTNIGRCYGGSLHANGLMLLASTGAVNTVNSYAFASSQLNISSYPVANIISEQCVRSGLSAGQFDVSNITDTVHGYTLTNPASARANVSPLMTAYAIDATEENGVVRFFYRSALTPVAVVAYTELSASDNGGAPGDPMPLARAQEADLPHTVSISYINRDFDYQTSTEKSIRQTTISRLDQTIDLPLSVGSDVAATTAQRVLLDAWNDRNKRSFKVTRKYAFVSPGDVVTITFQDGTLIDWRLTKVTDTGVLLEWEGVPADSTIYKQVVTGSAGYSPQSVAPISPPTQVQLLDIPLLRDADNNAGIYAALAGASVTSWLGAELFVGDDDTNLTSRGTVSADAPIGFAQTVLASARTGFIDESNIFTVNLGGDTFSSVTRDTLLSGGGEYWALGAPGRWEIGASAKSASLGNGLFVLSRHLRGLFGTERFTGTHTATDSFILLRIAGMLRPNMSVGDLGQFKSYRAVSTTRTFSSASSQKYSNTGEGLMPLSPLNLRRSTSPTNDITLSWDRRSRLSMNYMTGTVPLGETTEHYSVEFWTSSAFTTLAGTLTTTAASLTITSAQQSSFGLTPGATTFVRVRQYSDSIGVGHPLQATA
jgi:hypothetical protein